jgi:hypothetical protein
VVVVEVLEGVVVGNVVVLVPRAAIWRSKSFDSERCAWAVWMPVPHS